MRNSFMLVVGVSMTVRALASASAALRGVVSVPFTSISYWGDYQTYVSWLHYTALGLVPYRDFAFSYTPLFLYLLLPFYLGFGLYGPAIPIVLSDALTAGLVYLVVSKKATAKCAAVAGLAYALSPFILINEGYLWLSSQPMTLLIMLSFYLLLQEKPYLSMAALAFAILVKQEAVVLLPVFVAWQIKGKQPRILKELGIFATIVGAASTPFLLLAPGNYPYSLTYSLVKVAPLLPQVATATIATGWETAHVALSCTNTTIASLYTGAVCGGIGRDALSLVVFQTALYNATTLLSPVFLGLLGVSLYAVRRADDFLTLVSATSIVTLLLLFNYAVHSALAYYFVPVYALILCACTDRRAQAIGVIGTTLAAFIPEGAFQLLLPVSILFALVLAKDAALSKKEHVQPARTDRFTPVPARAGMGTAAAQGGLVVQRATWEPLGRRHGAQALLTRGFSEPSP